MSWVVRRVVKALVMEDVEAESRVRIMRVVSRPLGRSSRDLAVGWEGSRTVAMIVLFGFER